VKLLLDTHIWLWSLLDARQLSRRVQHELADPGNELWLSPVSTWEALLLHSKGRIELLGNLRDWVSDATGPLRDAPLTHEVVLAAHELWFQHPDPADRFLTATAQVFGLTLVTADRRLLGLGSIATLGNH
jgi:PIN domain nuclease of toxin-antitoxin system